MPGYIIVPEGSLRWNIFMELALGLIVLRVKIYSVESSEDFSTCPTKSCHFVPTLGLCAYKESPWLTVVILQQGTHLHSIWRDGWSFLQPQNGHCFHSLKDRV